MTPDKYILDEAGEPVKTDLMSWARQFELPAIRTVKKEKIGESEVSTIFLGIDHGWEGGPPVLWETMVFDGKLDQEQDRCSGKRADALAMHERMVAKVKAAQ